ncbi:hypothetical protein GQ457_06G017990 [Hibiscus cannabinus]
MMEFSGHKIPVTVEDVEVVLGLMNKGRDVEEATKKFDGKELAKKHKINTNAAYEQLEWDIVCGDFETGELKERVLLYIKDVAKIVLGSDDECSKGKEGGRKNSSNDVIMEMLENVILELGEIKEGSNDGENKCRKQMSSS